MASKDELKQAINLAATENNLEVPDMEDQTNAQLVDMLKALREDIAAATGGDEPADDTKPDENAGAKDAAKVKAAVREAKENAEIERPEFYVPDGKAITTKRGILSDGDEVKVEYLNGGVDTLAALIKSGHILEG